MNLGNIFRKDNRTTKTNDTGRVSDSMSKGERLYRLQNEIRNMKPGQTLQGTVVNRNGNSVQIELAQDFSINAKIDKSVSLALGQMMSFEIKANSGSLLSLAPLYTNTANTATILRALAAAGLPETAGNIEMVAAMMEEGMPIDKESILSMSRQIMDFPGQNPASVIQMTKLGLPVTEANIEQFEHYMNANHQILGSVETIMDELPQVFQELMAEGRENEAYAFYEAVLNIFTEDEAEGSVTLQGQAAEQAPEEQAAVQEDVAQTQGQPAAQDTAQAGIQQTGIQQTGEQQAEVPKPQDAAQAMQAQADGTVPDMAEETGTEGGRQTVLTDRQWNSLGDMLKKLGVEEDTARQVQKGEIPPKEVLNLIREFLPKAMHDPESGKVLDRLLGGREFQSLLKAEIGKQWLIEPREVADPKQVEQLYERVKEQTMRMHQALEAVEKGDTPVARSVQNLQNNVDFMNQMNHMYTYVQLPLKMLGSNAHGDLYVYTNKKNLAAKDGNVTALLHLDMEHLGPLDVYVSMQNQKVSTNFTVQDESILELIEKHIDLLHDRLVKRGYDFKAKMQIKEEQDDEQEQESIMRTILHQQKNISVLSRTSFDMRA